MLFRSESFGYGTARVAKYLLPEFAGAHLRTIPLRLVTTSALNRRIQTRLGSLAVADHGCGRPLMLWPSLFSDHRLYDHLPGCLGEGWRVIRVDGPGFGGSAPPQGDVQPAEYASVIDGLLDALGVKRTIFAGCSWGGQIAAHLGAGGSDRISGVLMMNTPLEPSRGRDSFTVLGTRWLGNTGFWGAGVARSMFSPASRARHPERVEAFVGAFRTFERRAAAQTARTVLERSPGLLEVLPRMRVPATILLGAEDRLYPVERMLPIAQRAPGARVEVLPACGHLAPIEAPEAVVAALTELVVRAHMV